MKSLLFLIFFSSAIWAENLYPIKIINGFNLYDSKENIFNTWKQTSDTPLELKETDKSFLGFKNPMWYNFTFENDKIQSLNIFYCYPKNETVNFSQMFLNFQELKNSMIITHKTVKYKSFKNDKGIVTEYNNDSDILNKKFYKAYYYMWEFENCTASVFCMEIEKEYDIGLWVTVKK
jgi:hypothetical protein